MSSQNRIYGTFVVTKPGVAIRGKTFRVRVPLVSQRTFLRCELSGIE